MKDDDEVPSRELIEDGLWGNSPRIASIGREPVKMGKRADWLVYASLAISLVNFYSIAVLFSHTSFLRRQLEKPRQPATTIRHVGRKVEDFALFHPASGQARLSEFLAKGPVSLYAWTYNCPACNQLMPEVVESYQKLPGTFLPVTFAYQ